MPLYDGEDTPSGVGGPDLEVVHAAGPAQGHRALLVGDVVALAEMTRCAASARVGLGRRAVGLDEGPRGRLLAEPALEGPMEVFDLALGLGMVRGPVPLLDAEVGEHVLEGVVAAA